MTEDQNESPFVEELQDGEAVVSLPSEPVQPEPEQASTPAQPEPSPAAELGSRYESEVRFLLFRLEKAEKAFVEFKRKAIWCLVALALVGFIGVVLTYLAANRAATQITELKPLMAAGSSFKFSSVTFSHWEQGQPAVRLIKSSEGLCVLTKVTGHFEGGGESVKLWIDPDGYWYLGGESHQRDVAADCAVLRY